MKRALLGVLVLAFAFVPGKAGAQGSTFDARVESVATVMIGFVATNFEFDVYNCPAGEPMEVVSWAAEQPDRPGFGTSVGTQPFGPSTGDKVQHLTLTTGGNFQAGLDWVGSGFVACGAEVVPVEGMGQTVAQTGV
jgi:hypothetical protein